MWATTNSVNVCIYIYVKHISHNIITEWTSNYIRIYAYTHLCRKEILDMIRRSPEKELLRAREGPFWRRNSRPATPLWRCWAKIPSSTKSQPGICAMVDRKNCPRSDARLEQDRRKSLSVRQKQKTVEASEENTIFHTCGSLQLY